MVGKFGQVSADVVERLRPGLTLKDAVRDLDVSEQTVKSVV